VRLRLLSLSLTAAAVLLAGCATTQPRTPQPMDDRAPAARPAPALPTAGDPAHNSGPISLDSNAATQKPPKAEVEPGTGKFINDAAAKAPVPSGPAQEGEVTFNFENQPIQAVVKAFLGDLLKQNYVIAPGVQGNVTFSTSKPIKDDQAMPILEMLLSWTNNTLVWGDGRYTVVPVKDAIAGKLTPRLGPPGIGKGYNVRVFPLRFISPKEMEKLLKPYAKSDAFVSIDTSRSMLVLAGSPAELENYQRTIDIFDVDWLKGMSIGVYPVLKVEVAKILPELDKLFGATGESPMAGMFRFIPIERTNSVIVITANEQYLATAEEWLRRLDQSGSESGTQLYVFDVTNIKAADLADRLNEVFTGQRSSSSSSKSSRGGVAPGLTPVQGTGGTNSTLNNSSAGTGSIGGTGSMRGGSGGSGGSGGDSGSHAGSFKLGDGDSEVRISAVEENNQLLVMATPSQWGIIETAIKRLDTQPLQVQIETKILEVSLSGALNYGVQWYLEGLIGSSAGSPEGHSQPGNIQQGLLGSGGVSPPSSGLFYSYIGPEIQAAIRALETSGNTRIVSAPSLLVLNNREADIQVGTKIPVVQTFFNPGYGSAVNTSTTGTTGVGYNSGSTQYLDTGIHLQVTPRVNPGGLVYMEVGQSVSKPGAKADADLSGNVPIEQRQLTTEIAVQSGQTILLGGLIQDTTQDTESGVPGLSRIPILGKLFGSTTRSNQRTELLILITPRVITSTDEARAVTDEYQRRFEGLRPLRNVRGAETRLLEDPKPLDAKPLPENKP
jgi:general secretion pathway protein D